MTSTNGIMRLDDHSTRFRNASIRMKAGHPVQFRSRAKDHQTKRGREGEDINH